MNVIIVGGGIAGLAFALQLHKRGISCQVYESAPEIKALGVPLNVRSIHHARECTLTRGTMDVLAASDLPPSLQAGVIDARAGQAAYDYVVKAIDLAQSKEIAGIVTAPLAKESMKQAGIAYPGHTEILAEFVAVNETRGGKNPLLVDVTSNFAEGSGVVVPIPV